jgi:hypothetical protein
MVKTYRVNQKDLQKGARTEQQEHKWASEQRARRIARDHLQKYGPGYYRAEPVNEKIVQNVNKRMGARPIRRPQPRPQPVTGFSGRLL